MALVVAGCGGPAPSASPSFRLSPTPSQSASARASALPTVPPDASPTISPAVPATQPGSNEITDLAVDANRVPESFTGHVSAFVSLGDQILWSGGPGATDNNLYRYVPGAAQPELLYMNAEHNSSLTSVAGSAAGYAFTDDRWVDGEPRGWRFWYLPTAGAEPVLLDQSTDDRLISPTIAMNERWIAWEVVHGTYEDPVNQLLVASVADPAAPITLLSYPGRDVYMQFPSLWQDELWYGIADNDWDALTEKPRVEMIDLSNRGAAPASFGADRRAFMPAPGRDVVAWKGGGTDEFAALSSGMLMVYWRADGQIDELPLPGRETAAQRISYPSVGNRFVAWWDDIDQRQYVYDLVEHRFRRIAEYDWSGEERIARPSLSEDLLVFTHYLSDAERYLEWCILPD